MQITQALAISFRTRSHFYGTLSRVYCPEKASDH